MNPEAFVQWLGALLSGNDETRLKLARPDVTTFAKEAFANETRDALVVCFPGGTFVLTVSKAGP